MPENLMKMMSQVANRRLAAGLLSIILVSGCAVPVRPDDLQTPRELSCVYLKEPLSFTGQYGMFNFPWTTRLERGPYWSEKMDEKGTYFRAPPGGVMITTTNGAGIPGQAPTADGGFYVPHSANEPVTIYKYFSTAAATTQVPSADINCSTVVLIKDPATSRLSLASFAAQGAIGGATGGLIGRSMNPGSNLSYGQAAGVGAAGGMISGLIIAAIINADVGKIVPGMPIQDQQFMNKLRELAAARVPIKEVQAPTVAGNTQSTTPAAIQKPSGEKQ